ncbi:PAS domain-containing protein [Hydrotalea sandarakina]|jgi:PAS domain S-box-containing protein|uniref:PAS domain S-box-containing protein n=1 Tax=Hydrotalea sandarakina TaxID=1004304 RepID=A0A2W7SCT7_9BACT|nr:PAS domain-containing protein [Hydrotalea sandarakina]PZX60675.1 PAS domain S-box-containing protein [Hydrotalea sandarakina]
MNYSNAAHPLLCWDIVVEGMARRNQLHKDLQALNKIHRLNNWGYIQFAYHEALIWENKTIIVTNTQLQIIYATENLLAMNGYHPSEVIGKRPAIFQGPETSVETRKFIKSAIQALQPFNTSIINYKKNGSMYTCHIEAFPIFDINGKLVNFMAIEKAA